MRAHVRATIKTVFSALFPPFNGDMTHCFAEGPLGAPSGLEKELARLYSWSDPEVVKPQER
jgi:hypothetical protein